MNRKGKHYKWETMNKSNKTTLDEVIIDVVAYMELSVASRKYLKATKRFNPKIDFRLQVEAEFCINLLVNIFKLSKSFIVNAQHTVSNHEKFKEEVKRFCNSIIPEKPLIVTDNLGREMAKIIQQDGFGKK